MRIMIISDVTTYQGLSWLVENLRPTHIVVAGDVLHDGKNLIYMDDDGSIISGLSMEDGRLRELHAEAFKEFVSTSASYVEKILLLYGDHDIYEDVNFSKLVKQWNLDDSKVVDVREPTTFELGELSFFLLSYVDPYEEFKAVIRDEIDNIVSSAVIITHLESFKLRVLIRTLQLKRSKHVLLVSGHNKLGYFPPGEAWRSLVADPLRIAILALLRLKPGKINPSEYRATATTVEKEELERFEWLRKDKIVHLARVDRSPTSFLLLEGNTTELRGSLYFLDDRLMRSRGVEFCRVKDTDLRLLHPLKEIFRRYSYSDHYKACEFKLQV